MSLISSISYFPWDERSFPNSNTTNSAGGLIFTLFYFYLFLSFFLLGPHQQHMEIPRLGVQSDLLLPAYARATATPDPSFVCDLHHSSGNAGSPTHWARPGTKPESSRILIGFVSATPQRELLSSVFMLRNYGSYTLMWNCLVMRSSKIGLYKMVPNCFPRLLYQITCSLAVPKCFHWFTSC